VKDALKWLTVLACAVTLVACAGSEKNAATTEESANSPEAGKDGALTKAVAKVIPVYREVTIPAGTTLRLDLASSIGSDTSKVEDAVRATVREAIVVDGKTVVPMGASLAGVVTDVADSGRVKGRARIAYRFNSLPVGDALYHIASSPPSHVAEATKGEDAKKIGIGAGAGAALGAILCGGSGAS
jgi:hypothetical protein